MDLHVLGHFRKLIQSTIHEKYPKIRTQIISVCPRRFTEAVQTVFLFHKFGQIQTTTKKSETNHQFQVLNINNRVQRSTKHNQLLRNHPGIKIPKLWAINPSSKIHPRKRLPHLIFVELDSPATTHSFLGGRSCSGVLATPGDVSFPRPEARGGGWVTAATASSRRWRSARLGRARGGAPGDVSSRFPLSLSLSLFFLLFLFPVSFLFF